MRRVRTELKAIEWDMVHVAGDVVAGFAGGTVGVVGTMLALNLKMQKVSISWWWLSAIPKAFLGASGVELLPSPWKRVPGLPSSTLD